MTVIEALEKVRSEVLERRENVWNRQVEDRARGSALGNMLERQEQNGRMDAYQNVAEYIDGLINDIEDAERECACCEQSE